MIYQFNNIEIDTSNFSLLDNGKEVTVEPQVFNLIVYLGFFIPPSSKVILGLAGWGNVGEKGPFSSSSPPWKTPSTCPVFIEKCCESESN